MNIFEIFEESIDVFKTNKMRTALSALGIIIGISSVIALITLGQAGQANVKLQIQSLGTNLLTIRPGAQQSGFLRGGGTGVKTLTNMDATAIATSDRITSIAQVAPEYGSRAQVSYERNNTNVQVTGVTADYFVLRNIQASSGTLFTDAQNKELAKVAVIAPTTATELFGEGVDPVGKDLRINGIAFRVIGLTKAKGGSGPMNQDEALYIPILVAQRIVFGVDYLSALYVGAKDEDMMEAAKNQVGFLLLELHRKNTPDEADFSISSQEDILATVTQVTQTFTTLLAGIAAISLVVGGIGIMNIMLVTVTERTAEVGLRKALGAKRKTIITQFLVESIVLTITGGLIGVVLGIGISLILTKVMSLPTTISIPSILLAVLVSSTIGIVFGWYPAWKASKLQPIEALRYE